MGAAWVGFGLCAHIAAGAVAAAMSGGHVGIGAAGGAPGAAGVLGHVAGDVARGGAEHPHWELAFRIVEGVGSALFGGALSTFGSAEGGEL